MSPTALSACIIFGNPFAMLQMILRRKEVRQKVSGQAMHVQDRGRDMNSPTCKVLSPVQRHADGRLLPMLSLRTYGYRL